MARSGLCCTATVAYVSMVVQCLCLLNVLLLYDDLGVELAAELDH